MWKLTAAKDHLTCKKKKMLTKNIEISNVI